MAIDRIRAQLKAIYDLYRTALMNEKYNANRLTLFRRLNFFYEAFLALGASSTIAAWSLWKTETGRTSWSAFGGFVAVLVVLKPVFQIPKLIEEYSKRHTGYRGLYLSLDDMVSEIAVKKTLTPEDEVLFEGAKKQGKELALTDPEHVNEKLLRQCQEEVEQKIPPTSFWYP